MADCDRRRWCRSRAGIARRPSAAGMEHGRVTVMGYPGRCSTLRLVLTLVLLVPVTLVPVAAPVPVALGTIHAWAARARVVLWFGRMQ
jgi:hypothetical protein